MKSDVDSKLYSRKKQDIHKKPAVEQKKLILVLKRIFCQLLGNLKKIRKCVFFYFAFDFICFFYTMTSK